MFKNTFTYQCTMLAIVFTFDCSHSFVHGHFSTVAKKSGYERKVATNESIPFPDQFMVLGAGNALNQDRFEVVTPEEVDIVISNNLSQLVWI